MSEAFELAAGSVAGRDHRIALRNNQDALCTWQGPGLTVAVVADGCGSGAHSELGARLGARLLAEHLRASLGDGTASPEPAAVLERARPRLLDVLHATATAMGGPLEAVVGEHLLFTLVGAVVTADRCWGFLLGDGVAGVNGELTVFAAADNAPPYLGYALTRLGPPPAFALLWDRPANAIDWLAVGTDGVAEVAQGDPHGRFPSLEALARDDRLFANPQALPRRLAVAARDLVQPDWEARHLRRQPGLFADDTTLVLVRRRAG